MTFDLARFRNFSIIAHIDHGKSTLADRFIEKTGALLPHQVHAQHLDNMELERERGITIKAKTVRMEWKGFILNLIDTPGHVDFTYEVHRALWASEGVLLVVDASQGVQAQTVANCAIARKAGLAILPVVNKIDLPNARPDEVGLEIMEILGLDVEPFMVSAKLGTGVEALLDGIVRMVPPPQPAGADAGAGLVFDSSYDLYKGVALLARLFEGHFKAGDKIRFFHDAGAKTYLIEELGFITPQKQVLAPALRAGEAGYIFCGLKDPREIRHGDTILLADDKRERPLRALTDALKPFIFVGIYPVQTSEVEALGQAFEKLHLTDPSFEFIPEHSVALGPGFRCGFLGLLHLEIIEERLKREFNQNIIITNPSVSYIVHAKKGRLEVNSPARFPAYGDIVRVEEPYVRAKILTPPEYSGPIMELLKAKRAVHEEVKHLTPSQVILIWRLPLAEMVIDFYDRLKSVSRGYASLDYEMCGYFCREELIKVDILIQGEACDALSFIAPKQLAYEQSREMLAKLQKLIPRQMFEVSLQAACQGRMIVKERIASLRKDVIAKCYGGDITRKMKLLAKQREGKKKMRVIGRVEIPPEAFLTVLKR